MMENGTKPGEMIPDATDVENNKVMAILAYFGLLVLVPIFAAKESPYARFHANQGLLLLITGFVLGVIVNILSMVLVNISPGLAMIPSILYLATFVLFILGVINAATGKMKELPVIGKYRILK